MADFSHIVSITGLQTLTNLQDFNADWNALQTVNLSGLSNLTLVDISDNDELSNTGIKSLNLTGCTSLLELRADDNDFSAGFPDLSTCTDLEWMDFDQCHLQGSINLSNLPNLKGFDFYGNIDITEVIISSSQPLGDGRYVDCSGTSLTQASVDGMLHALASGSVSNGEFYCEDGNQENPSEYGVEAIRVLNSRGWLINVQQYSSPLTLTGAGFTGGEACTDLLANNVTANAGYIHRDTVLEVGNTVYDDYTLFITKGAGWYGVGDGGVTMELDSNGVVTQITACI